MSDALRAALSGSGTQAATSQTAPASEEAPNEGSQPNPPDESQPEEQWQESEESEQEEQPAESKQEDGEEAEVEESEGEESTQQGETEDKRTKAYHQTQHQYHKARADKAEADLKALRAQMIMDRQKAKSKDPEQVQKRIDQFTNDPDGFLEERESIVEARIELKNQMQSEMARVETWAKDNDCEPELVEAAAMFDPESGFTWPSTIPPSQRAETIRLLALGMAAQKVTGKAKKQGAREADAKNKERLRTAIIGPGGGAPFKTNKEAPPDEWDEIVASHNSSGVRGALRK